MGQNSSWEANSRRAIQKLPNILQNPKLISMFTKALHWSLPSARWIHSIPIHLISLRSILILSPHLRLSIPSRFFPSGSLNKILYAFLFSLPFLLHVLPSHPPWPDHSNYIWWGVQGMKLPIMQFYPASYYFIPFGPDILNTLFLNTLSLYFTPIQNCKQNYSFRVWIPSN
jgi:hypothetical protein